MLAFGLPLKLDPAEVCGECWPLVLNLQDRIGDICIAIDLDSVIVLFDVVLLFGLLVFEVEGEVHIPVLRVLLDSLTAEFLLQVLCELLRSGEVTVKCFDPDVPVLLQQLLIFNVSEDLLPTQLIGFQQDGVLQDDLVLPSTLRELVVLRLLDRGLLL